MSIISFSLRELPRFTEESPVGYYPVVANAGKFTPEQLYETVQNRCTVTSTDIVAVMDALVNVVAENSRAEPAWRFRDWAILVR